MTLQTFNENDFFLRVNLVVEIKNHAFLFGPFLPVLFAVESLILLFADLPAIE